MQIRESTLDDLEHVDAICDSSDRTRWTSEMIEHNTASIRMHETLNFRPVARFAE